MRNPDVIDELMELIPDEYRNDWCFRKKCMNYVNSVNTNNIYCPNCYSLRNGKGSLIVKGEGVFCDESCYSVWNIIRSIAKINAFINADEFYATPISDDTVELSIQFYDRIKGFTNQIPHISTEDNGEVTFEYQQKSKMLCFFVNPDSTVEALQCWGPHIWEEMKETKNPTDEDLVGLWGWFNV